MSALLPILANYLTQPSTYRGLMSLLVSVGLINIAPQAQDAVVGSALQLIAAGAAVKGSINIIRNEKKKAK